MFWAASQLFLSLNTYPAGNILTEPGWYTNGQTTNIAQPQRTCNYNRYYANLIFCRGVLGLCRETPVVINWNIATRAAAGRQPGSTSQLLVECSSCGSREPRDLQQSEISSRSIWCDYSRLNWRLTTRRPNYREIKVLISPKCASNSSGQFAISFLPFHQKSFCCPQRSVRNKHARLGSLYFLSRTCQKQPESIIKTLLIPSEAWDWISRSFLCSTFSTYT